jgi:peptidyl-dipeptidase Dcp
LNVLEKESLRPGNVWNNLKQRKDLPLAPDVVAYEVDNGKSMVIYYLDFYTRDNKNEAWMNNFVDQSHLKQKPVIVAC